MERKSFLAMIGHDGGSRFQMGEIPNAGQLLADGNSTKPGNFPSPRRPLSWTMRARERIGC